MTKAEFMALVDDACGESELHASYSLPKREYDATRLSLHAIRAGVRDRLKLPPALQTLEAPHAV